MKQTFSNKVFNWALIGISLIFSVLTIMSLYDRFDFFSVYLIKIVFAFISVTALISLIVKEINGELYSRLFIVTVVIFPGIFVLNEFITDLVFYGAYRPNLLRNPTLFFQLLSGITLLYFAIKFSKQPRSARTIDYGILIIGIGIYTILYVMTRFIEPFLNLKIIEYPIWKAIIKSIIGVATLIIGLRTKNGKIKFKKSLILTIILVFIFGLI